MDLKIIKKTKHHIWVNVDPLFKGKKKIPKYITIRNLKDIKFIYKNGEKK